MLSKGFLSDFALRFEEYVNNKLNLDSLSLSPVDIDDMTEIVNFYSEAFIKHRWFGTRAGSRSLQSFFSDSLTSPGILWLKLESGGATAGFSALIEDGDFLYSDETLISDAFQGRGIGTIYFRALCAVARQQQKPIYGDIVYSKHSRVIARVFAHEFGLVPIGFVLTRTRQNSPLVMVRIATQKSLQHLSQCEQTRLISDAIHEKNNELRTSSTKCVGFNHDTNVPILIDDQELMSYLLTQNDPTEVRPVACLLESIKLQIASVTVS